MAVTYLMTIIILISAHDSYQQSTLSIKPENQAAVLGSNVTFQCQVTQSDALTDYISWEECITTNSSNCARISNDEIIVYSALGGDNNKEARYSIEVVGSKQFNLMISGITAEDAGQYRCLSRNNAEAHYSAELVVLDSEPVCECNTTDDTPSGLPVYVSCQVDYYGIQSPEVVFVIGEDKNLTGIDGSVIGSAYGHMEYNITHPPEDEDMCKDLYAKTKFSNFLTDDRIASNAPTYEYLYTCFIPGDGCFTTAMASTPTTDKPGCGPCSCLRNGTDSEGFNQTDPYCGLLPLEPCSGNGQYFLNCTSCIPLRYTCKCDINYKGHFCNESCQVFNDTRAGYTSKQVSVNLGDSHTEICSTNRSKSLYWQKKGTTTTLNSTIKQYLPLYFSKVCLDDSSTYCCYGNDDECTQQRCFTLRVQKKWEPIIESDKKDNNGSETCVTKGESVEVNCTVSGYPEPKVQWWYYENDTSPSDSGVVLWDNRTLGLANLVITNVQPEDERSYYCRASYTCNGIDVVENVVPTYDLTICDPRTDGVIPYTVPQACLEVLAAAISITVILILSQAGGLTKGTLWMIASLGGVLPVSIVIVVTLVIVDTKQPNIGDNGIDIVYGVVLGFGLGSIAAILVAALLIHKELSKDQCNHPMQKEQRRLSIFGESEEDLPKVSKGNGKQSENASRVSYAVTDANNENKDTIHLPTPDPSTRHGALRPLKASSLPAVTVETPRPLPKVGHNRVSPDN